MHHGGIDMNTPWFIRWWRGENDGIVYNYNKRKRVVKKDVEVLRAYQEAHEYERRNARRFGIPLVRSWEPPMCDLSEVAFTRP